MNALAIVAAALVLAGAIAVSGRYAIAPDTSDPHKHLAWRLDRWTGSVDLCGWNGDAALVYCDRSNGRDSNGH